MIKIENVDIYGWEAAIRGMRNPMNSWEKSDSYRYQGPEDPKKPNGWVYDGYEIGDADLDLMKRLVKGGATHAKFRRMINVTMDITAPLYWWKEFDTYKVGTVANSCSTMHKIQANEFTLEDFSCEHLSRRMGLQCLKNTIETLNEYRRFYNNWDKIDDNSKSAVGLREKKDAWWQMIQLLPSSFNQRRTVQLNYEVLAHMYHDRKDHKLDEWKELCKTIEELPYAKELIIGE